MGTNAMGRFDAKKLDRYMMGIGEQPPTEGCVFEPTATRNPAAAGTVLKAGARVTLRAGGGLHHGCEGQQRSEMYGGPRGARIRYRFRNTQLELTGPLSAGELVRAFTLHVALEVGRNHMLATLLSGEGEDDEATFARQGRWRPPNWRGLTAEERARFESTDGPPAVLELSPDPLEGTPEAELLKMGYEALNGGATDLLGFTKCTDAPAGGPPAYVAVWGDPYA